MIDGISKELKRLERMIKSAQRYEQPNIGSTPISGTPGRIPEFATATTVGDSQLSETITGGVLTFVATLTANRSFNLPDANVTISQGGNVAVGAGTLTQATGNDATIANHTHEITSTDDGTGIVAATIAAFNAAGQLTASDYFTNDGGQFGISGNELLTVDAAGLFKFTGIAGVTVEDGDYIGIASDVRIKFDATSGYIDAILGDAAGADEVRVVDSAGSPVATVDSNGNGYFLGNLDVDGVFKLVSSSQNFKISTGGNVTTALDFDFPDISTAIGTIRVFRTTNTSGLKYIDLFKGDGTSTTHVRLGVDGTNSFINAGARFGIGTTSPASRLDIADGALTMAEMTAPSAPAANSVVIYAEDNGSGKTRLMALFSSGAAQQIAIQP